MKKTAYIDSNIIIDYEEGVFSKNQLINSIDSDISELFYSTAHINETLGIKKESISETNNLIFKRLETIKSLTESNYLYVNLSSNKIIRQKYHPENAYNDIDSSFNTRGLFQTMLNLISEEQRKIFREELNVDLKRLNNYSPSDVIEHINFKLETLNGLSLIDFIENAMSYHPKHSELGLDSRITGMFEILDIIGYWKDSYNKKSNHARFWDANHTFYSSFCDYFISSDRRAIMKAKVAFEIYNIKTVVKEFKVPCNTKK